MNGLLILQIVALQIFILCVLCGLSQAIVKRIFPSTVRQVLYGWGACGLLGLILAWTVPGRARHLEFFKHILMDEVVAKDFNGGGSGLRNWLGTKFGDFAADIVIQQIRVEKIGVVSIGLIEAEWGWSPVTIGFAGIVFPNFFIDVPTYETPQVNIELAKDAEGNCQVVLQNNDAANYTCSVSSYAGTPLCKFELEAQSLVRIQQEKKGLKNKIKKMITGDKSLVTISEPIEQSLNVGFKRGGRTLKRANVMLSNDAVKVHWSDPK